MNPPGPKGVWYLGLTTIPMKKAWLTYITWGKKYGDLIHFSRFGKHYLIINSLEAARDILDKQSKQTGDRAHTQLDKISGMDDFFGKYREMIVSL
ncbi:hypothetical protein D9758_017576 [Tetrapyrgos nigripes]|uniref:Uncharacterized protein n=1 Tax=Tetrapyrgos nigripes TaxID=182062 RepID=A0A8H5CBC4_9AGAR|nr:hypothetical protein D9758_017576 [Tetrapyrgos nigripes]